MHCLAFPSALFGAPFHIDNRTVTDCGFWLEYASKTPLEIHVVADLPHRMRLFWLRCQIMRLRSVHIKPHYSQNAFDSALLAWYERGIYKSKLQVHVFLQSQQIWLRQSWLIGQYMVLIMSNVIISKNLLFKHTTLYMYSVIHNQIVSWLFKLDVHPNIRRTQIMH